MSRSNSSVSAVSQKAVAFHQGRRIAATLEKIMSKDSELKKVVLEELSWSLASTPPISASRPKTRHHLTGHVDTTAARPAEKAASRVKGVQSALPRKSSQVALRREAER